MNRVTVTISQIHKEILRLRQRYEFNQMCGNTHTEIVILRSGQYAKFVQYFQIRKDYRSKREARVHYVNTR